MSNQSSAGPHRDLNKARDAFLNNDVETSKLVHQAKQTPQQEDGHNLGGEHVKSVVMGGLDGILTTFSIVAGAVGGGMSVRVILILGASSFALVFIVCFSSFSLSYSVSFFRNFKQNC